MKQTTFRMNPELELILEALVAKLGVGQNDVMRIAIRKLAEREGIEIGPQKTKKRKPAPASSR